MIKLNFSLSILLIIACSFFSVSCTRRSKEPNYCKYMDEITTPYIRYVKSEYDLTCIGGGGSFIDNVKKVSLHFISYRNLDLSQARILFVNCVEEILFRINKDQQIRPFLSNYPFNERNIDFTISFYQKNEKRVSKKYVALLFSARENTIKYDYYNDESDDLKFLYRESYPKALQIVKDEGNLKLSASN